MNKMKAQSHNMRFSDLIEIWKKGGTFEEAARIMRGCTEKSPAEQQADIVPATSQCAVPKAKPSAADLAESQTLATLFVALRKRQEEVAREIIELCNRSGIGEIAIGAGGAKLQVFPPCSYLRLDRDLFAEVLRADLKISHAVLQGMIRKASRPVSREASVRFYKDKKGPGE